MLDKLWLVGLRLGSEIHKDALGNLYWPHTAIH